MKKNYIFDLYGTLLDIHTDENTTYLWNKIKNIYSEVNSYYKSISADEFKELFNQCCIKQQQQLDKDNPDNINELDYYKVFYELLILNNDNNSLLKNNKKIKEFIIHSGEMFRVASMQECKLYDDVIETLQSLKDNGCKLFLLSNAQRLFTYNELKEYGLVDYLDDIFISSDYGIKKPDPIYLQLLIRKNNLNIDDCIMVGNEIGSDIKVAYLNNMESILFNTNRYTVIQQEELLSDFNKEYKFRIIENFKELLEG